MRPSVADAIARLYTALNELPAGSPAIAAEGDAARRWSRPKPGCATISRRTATIFRRSRRRRRRWAARSATRCRWPSRCGGGSRKLGGRRRGWSPPEMLGNASQHYDPQPRLLMLSSLLRSENRTFALAYQLALARVRAADRAHGRGRARRPTIGSRRLLHMSLANYAAGAIMMPYGNFLRAPRSIATRSTGCAAQFGANVEQVAHRLTTLEPRRARAACRSSCSGSIPPATSPSATPATISLSPVSAGPARAGTSTPPSRPRARSSAS